MRKKEKEKKQDPQAPMTPSLPRIHVAPSLKKGPGRAQMIAASKLFQGLSHDFGDESQQAMVDFLHGGAASSSTSLLLRELKCIGLVVPPHFVHVRILGGDAVHATNHIGLETPFLVQDADGWTRSKSFKLTLPDPWEWRRNFTLSSSSDVRAKFAATEPTESRHELSGKVADMYTLVNDMV